MIGRRYANGNSHLFVFAALAFGMFSFLGCGGGGGGSDTPVTPTAPGIALSATSIEFPSTVLNQTEYLGVTVQNSGTANLVIGQIALATGAPFAFSAGACTGQTLGPNESCAVEISFTPTVEGAFTDTITIPSNAGDRTVTVSGDGQGLKVTITEVDTTGYPTVKMLVSVTDSANQPITTLAADDFTVFEGTSEKAILTFANVGRRPVSVVMALDFSGSIISSQALEAVKNSAKSFLRLLDPLDEAAVMKFGAGIDWDAPLTSVANLNVLDDAIDNEFSYAGIWGTQVFEAAYQAATLLATDAVNDHKIVIVVSDFRPNIETRTIEEAISNATGANVAIYTIGFGDVLTDVMGQLADETGGQSYLRPDTEEELETAYEAIAGLLNNEYELTFETIAVLGTVNELTVEVVDGVLHGNDTVSVTY